MKKFLFVYALLLTTVGFGQSRPPRTFLLVHGAWSGGWDYARVDALLRAKGDRVYRPTLTGLGERVHLANATVNLSTYVADIVNVIRFENLHNVILVGHSFGGMVISGVAEQVPDRISQLIYLDAMVPNDGESAQAVCGALWNGLMASHVKDSVLTYPFGPTSPAPPTDVPQPLKTFTEPLAVRNPLVKKIPAAYVQMTKNGKSAPATDQMGLNRARQRNWPIYPFEGGHYSMREQPENLVKKLDLILEKKP